MTIDSDTDSNFKSLEEMDSQNFGQRFHENSDRKSSDPSDRKEQKLRKLPKTQLIKKASVKPISIKLGGKGTKADASKVTKFRQLLRMRKYRQMNTTESTHVPNDITESSDLERDHYSNHVLQIMQRARPSIDGEPMRSFLDITDLWNRKPR